MATFVVLIVQVVLLKLEHMAISAIGRKEEEMLGEIELHCSNEINYTIV